VRNNQVQASLLARPSVQRFECNYFKNSKFPQAQLLTIKEYDRFRVAANFGYSYQIAKTPQGLAPSIRDYGQALKSGYHFSFDGSVFLNEMIGLGIMYSQFNTANRLPDGIYLEDAQGNRTYGQMSDDINLNFIGPSLCLRYFNAKKTNALIMHIRVGQINYYNEAVLVNPLKLTGTSFAFAYDIGYDLALTKSISLGFQLCFVFSNMFRYNESNGARTRRIRLPEGQHQSLSRVDLGVGLRFGK
jgi:hypothetical protein